MHHAIWYVKSFCVYIKPFGSHMHKNTLPQFLIDPYNRYCILRGLYVVF